jgi:NADP-dependent 3-hydroxy acid dehydrogenase YdfG
MPSVPFRSIWIIGASTGIGHACALAFAAHGVRVVASARSQDALDALSKEAGDHADILPLCLDVTDQTAVQEALPKLEAQLAAPLDALLYCAATWNNDPSSQAKADSVRPVFEVNVFGCLHVLEAVLPKFKERRCGHIALVSSVAGFRGLPRALSYGASKAAMTHIAEALVFECAKDCVGIQVIHPGFVKTPLTDKNDFNMPFLMSAETAAQRILKGMIRAATSGQGAGKHFEITFPRRFTYWLKLLRLLPYRCYFWLVTKATRNL